MWVIPILPSTSELGSNWLESTRQSILLSTGNRLRVGHGIQTNQMRGYDIFPKDLRRCETLQYISLFSTTNEEPANSYWVYIQSRAERLSNQGDLAELWIKPYLKLAFF